MKHLTNSKWDIPWYTTRERCITILYHAIETTLANQCDIPAAHDGKVGCNTVGQTTGFLYSDWLYFLWHGIKVSAREMVPAVSGSICVWRTIDLGNISYLER